MDATTNELRFPFATPPATGTYQEVAPGILWIRVPLPFRLDHINIYLIEDDDGWAVLDTGIANTATRELWDALLAGPLAGRKLTRLIVTHFHPDHIGLAGWLCERFGIPLLTSQTSYLNSLNISLSPAALDAKPYHDFYKVHGVDDATTARVSTNGHSYLKMVVPLPPTFTRLVAGDTLRIGKRRFEVLSGDGHAPEQLMLYCESDKIFLAADQVLARITPNISVWPVDPSGDPLGLFLRSLRALQAEIPADVLVLPGHQLPFYGLHARIEQLIAHHEARCADVATAAAKGPISASDLVPVIFRRPITDPHQMSFAFSEGLAHVNYMLRQERLAWADDLNGVKRVIALPEKERPV